MPKSATVADIMEMRPCPYYTVERVTELYAGREALTLAEILALDIPADDRLWVAFTGYWFDRAGYVELACRMAEQAVRRAKSSLEHVPEGEARPQVAITAAEEAIAAARSGDAARVAWAAGDAAWAAGDAAWEAWAAWAARAAWVASDAAWEAKIEIVRAYLAELEAV